MHSQIWKTRYAISISKNIKNAKKNSKKIQSKMTPASKDSPAMKSKKPSTSLSSKSTTPQLTPKKQKISMYELFPYSLALTVHALKSFAFSE